MRIKVEGMSALTAGELERDCRAALDAGRVRVGEAGLYLTRFSGTLCLPYGALTRAWLRQEEVNASLCCGRANFDQFFLMAQDRTGKVWKGELQNKELGKAALARLGEKAPGIEIGYRKT